MHPRIDARFPVGFYDTPVLVVDDSKAVRTVLVDLLKENGFRTVDSAGSVADGQKAYDKRHHPIVFLDLLMPEASGLRFARYALEHDAYCKIVVTTALPPNNEGVITAISEGAFDILQKPIRPEDLAGMLQKLERASGGPVAPRGEDVSYR